MPNAKQPGRADRLKAALRENLKRRKNQARERRAEDVPTSETPATDKRHSSGE